MIYKTIKLISVLPKIFFLGFALFFIFTAVTIFFELLGFSLLIPLLNMMTENSLDTYNFPKIVLEFNGLIIRYFNFNFLNNLLSLVIVVFIIFTIKLLFQFTVTWISAKISIAAQHFYAVKLYRSYLKKDYLFHQKNPASDLFRNVIVEVNNFTSSILFQLLTVLLEVSVIMSIFIFLYFVDPAVVSVIFIMIIMLLIIYYSMRKILNSQGTKRVFNEGKRISTVQNSLESIKDVILYDIASLFLQSFKSTNWNLQKTNFVLKILQSVPRFIFEFIAVGIMVLTIYIFKDHSTGNIFQIIGLFLLAAFRALPSLSKIASSLQGFVFLKPSLDFVYKEFVQKKNKSILIRETKDILEFNKQISFHNVSYSYLKKDKNKNNYLLNDINLIIKKGKKIGIIGDSGFGKSTLLDILLGFVKPDRGYLKSDKIKLKDKNFYSLRKKIGYVGQKISILNGGIIENIILDKKYDEIKFKRIIKNCELENFFKKRYHDISLLDNMNRKISGGELQRLGIARALYQDPEIILMDESTNALDAKTEKKILKFIYSLKNVTLLIIAHNSRALFGCNFLLNFYKKGKYKIINNIYEKK